MGVYTKVCFTYIQVSIHSAKTVTKDKKFMNFYTFEYEKEIDFESIRFDDSEYIQTIKNKNYFFLHQKLYGHNYPDDWSDEQKKETKTGVVSGLEQLKEQIFILIDTKEKHIFF